MSGYGQFCPVAKAMEVLDERWTLLVVRELLLGSRHWGDLRRGVPRMSPALLSKRLQSLERHGIVVRQGSGTATAYDLTEAGRDLYDVVMSLGAWGIRWVGDLGTRTSTRTC
ncbi:winged helix-turn-helix transcriptional regulator [Lapillicoccus jejuensis]|uniref:winged helix-turn-helix transcriptional regulator n=1 Tax=Lapillicoccus jejuensis TaxID=402171 RepID=UPI001B87E37D|nr:helix-turn-helix domain-containing protein [Lapillicoccus jejuensis]